MNILTDLRGIVTVFNTPFTHDDYIEEPGLRRHVNYAVEAGVASILAPAMAGEVGKLTREERLSLVDAIVDETAGRVPIVGGASAPDQATILANARSLIGAGCDGVLAQIPFTSEEHYEGTVEALCALEPGFVILQDWDAAGPGLPVEFIARLAKTYPQFSGIKIEVMPAGPKYTEVLEATQGRLHVSGGWGALQLVEGFARGLHAFMPTALHRAYVTVYNEFQAGNVERANSVFNRMLPILAFTNQHLDVSIHFFKRLLHAQGVYETNRVRDPILPFDAMHERVAEELIEAAIQLENELGAQDAIAKRS